MVLRDDLKKKVCYEKKTYINLVKDNFAEHAGTLWWLFSGREMLL